MKPFLLSALMGITIFFGAPMLNEYSVDPCSAYNNLAGRTGAPAIRMGSGVAEPMGGVNLSQVLQGAARGQVPQIRQQAQPVQADPMIGLTCTTRYWQQLTGIGKA